MCFYKLVGVFDIYILFVLWFDCLDGEVNMNHNCIFTAKYL